ncbi:MAG: hydroxymethylbilane synthase [Candidatus Limnocylindrales bacterium]
MTITKSGTIRIGTRGSALALVQAQLVAAALGESGVDVGIEAIATDGDRRSPDTTWGEGAFVTAIEQALLSGTVDVAVHSAKDVPTDEDPRLTIAAYLPREWPEDVLVLQVGMRATGLDALPVGARVGTDSPRRSAFLRAARPDLSVHPLHGNVDTRLRRLDAGETDALVLAAAGLRRLGRADRISSVLGFATMPSAPGQGALAIQIRTADAATRRAVAALDDADTRRSVEAERRLLRASGGGCRAPIGALGRIVDGRLELRAGFASVDGRIAVTASVEPATDRAGVSLKEQDDAAIATVLGDIAARAAERASAMADRPVVVVTRPVAASAGTVLALVDRGVAPVVVPTIAFALPDHHDLAALDSAFNAARPASWVVLTSVRAVEALVDRAAGFGPSALASLGSRWAAVGEATARAARTAGLVIDFQPETATGRSLADGLPLSVGGRIVVPRGDLADTDLPRRLIERGARVEELVVYRTIEGPTSSSASLRLALARTPAAVVMSSGSAVRGWLRLAEAQGQGDRVRSIPVVAIGPTTAREARSHGMRVLAEATSPATADITDAVVAALAIPAEEPH